MYLYIKLTYSSIFSSVCLYTYNVFLFLFFSAILDDIKKSANPFLQSKVPRLQKALQEHAKELQFTLNTRTESMKQRNRKTVSKTFHGLGLLVPVEKRTEIGYRELIETDGKLLSRSSFSFFFLITVHFRICTYLQFLTVSASLKKILNRVVRSERQADKDKALDQLQQVITAANIANDECDFGTSVELGLDLFTFGGTELQQSALQLLSTGYNLLGRKEFAKIAQVICQVVLYVIVSDE